MKKKNENQVVVTIGHTSHVFGILENAAAWLSGFVIGKAAGGAVDDVLEIGTKRGVTTATVITTGVEVSFDTVGELTKWIEGFTAGNALAKPPRKRRRKPRKVKAKPKAKPKAKAKPAKKKAAPKKKTVSKKAKPKPSAPIAAPGLPRIPAS